MADGVIQVPADSVGKRVDTTELIRPDGTTVERQRVTIGDEDNIIQTQTRLLHEIVMEIRDLKMALLSALH